MAEVNLSLMQLTLENFKGIEYFNLEVNGNNAMISGANGTGKTTIYDGFIWLLFGKDSQNKTDFEIKTLDENGEVKNHDVEHKVIGTFKLNGKRLTLARVLKEKWTKPRGSRKHVFKGNETKYFIDEVPVKKKEFDEQINQIAKEDIFKLLTNPDYFNEHLNWKERRNILIEMAGEVTNEDILNESDEEDLEEIIEKSGDKSIEDYQKILHEKKKSLEKELDMIPIRIDELKRSNQEADQIDKKEAESKINEIHEEIQKKQQEIIDLKTSDEATEKAKRLNEIELKMNQMNNESSQKRESKKLEVQSKVAQLENDIRILENRKTSIESQMDLNKKQVDYFENELPKLRDQWREVDSMKFNHDHDVNCYACGQALPEEKIEEAHEKAKKEFNKDKSKQLEEINREGQEIKAKAEKYKEENDRLEKEHAGIYSDLIEKQEELDQAKKQLKSFENEAENVNQSDEYQRLLEEKEAIENQKVKVVDTEEIENQIRELEEEKQVYQGQLQLLRAKESADKRIKELEANEKELNEEFEGLEFESYLAEEFTRSKIKVIEKRIADKFNYPTFKLFQRNIDGELKETCETLYQGVPYSRGLNNASKINIGLDIINTLNEFYGIYVPIFIDNSESVTDLVEMETQMVQLVVDKNYEELEVDLKARQVA